MPSPANFGDQIVSMQEQDKLDPKFKPVEGTKWQIPPHLKLWEEAIGLVRPSNVQFEVDIEANAQAVAQEVEADDGMMKLKPLVR